MANQIVASDAYRISPGTLRQFWIHRRRSAFKYIGFAIFAFIVGFPFYYIVMSSVTPRNELYQIPPSYWPKTPTFENYVTMADADYWLFFGNSLIFAVGSSVVSVACSALAAYALARIHFPGSNFVFIALILSVALPQIAVLVPLFQTFQTFRMVNTYGGLIILMSSLILPFTVFVLVSFVQQIPAEIEEAALIDGANTIQVLFRVVFPLMRPALITMLIINFIIAWNELLYPLVFAQRDVTKTLSVGLIELTSDSSTFSRPWHLMSAMSVTMVIPILLLVLLGQRMIIAGLSRGAIK